MKEFDERDIPAPAATVMDAVVILHSFERSRVLTAAEAEQLSADLLRAAAAARAYRRPTLQKMHRDKRDKALKRKGV